MFKKTLIAALALAGAGSAMAAQTSPENFRLVIVWGDDFVSGYQSAAEAAPTAPSLAGSGYFFGDSGYSNDTRGTAWVPNSYTNGFSGPDPDSTAPVAGGTEIGAGIAFMGKRFTGDKVLILNLASPSTDIAVGNRLVGGRWPNVGVLTDGSAKALPSNSDVRGSMATAISALATLAPNGATIDMNGIVFSCWNNFTADLYGLDINFDTYTQDGTFVPGAMECDRADWAAECNEAAGQMCDTLEKTFREEFEAAYGNQGLFTLTGVKPTIVGLRRPDSSRGWTGFMRTKLDFAPSIYNINQTGGYAVEFIEDGMTVPSPSEVYGPQNSRGMVFVGDSDGLYSLPTVHQYDYVHLSNEAMKYVGWQMGATIFN
jgi:hypothetical protein